MTFSFTSPFRDAMMRWIGYIILTRMPEDGLKEAVTCLKDILQYTIEDRYYSSVEPTIVHTTPGTINSVSERQDLIL
ncbi:MAG: hypothetical protein WBN92_01605 [Terriglobia bacterium]